MPRDFPRRNELVVATVKRVEEHGVIAELEEYEGLEAYIPRGHVASGRIKDIRDFVKEGDRVVGRVIRADRVRRQVDLSLRYVSRDQAERKLREWKERSRALSLIRVAATRAGVRNPEEAARRILAGIEDAYESALEALEDALGHPEVLDRLGVPKNVAEHLIPLIREQLKPPLYIKEVTLKLVAPTPNGVEVIREALLRGTSIQSEKVSIEAFTAGAPRYVVRVSSRDPSLVRRMATTATKRILEEVRSSGGRAEVVSEREVRKRTAEA